VLKETDIIIRILARTMSGIVIASMFMFATADAQLIVAQTSQPENSKIISERARPLADAAKLLQGQYGKPVTYEDPILIWHGDKEAVRYLTGNTGFLPARLSFSIPNEASPDKTPILDASILGKVIDSYHEQTDGPRFEVSTSRWGLHIIPKQVRDANGQFTNTTSLLDTKISIPIANRTPSEHFVAICSAVTAVNPFGIKLRPNGQWMEQYFAEKPLPRMLTPDQREKTSFVWGADNVDAREAMINLLEHSSTTMSWSMLCQVDEGFCVLNLSPITVDEKYPDGTFKGEKTLEHDRNK
jgi:hypothetical protein